MAFIRAPKFGSTMVMTDKNTMDNPYNKPQAKDNIYMFESYELGKGGEKQQWNYIPVTGLPGVYRIQNNFDPTLYITTPPSPKVNDWIYLDTIQTESDGSPAKAQLWTLGLITPNFDKQTHTPSSIIQNYSTTGYVINVTGSKVEKPLQLYYRADSDNEKFFNDLSPPQ